MKIFYKFFVFILCVFTLSSATVYATEGGSKDVIISIGEKVETPTAVYSQKVDLNIPLINYGKHDALDVVITPVLDSSTEAFPFEIEQMNYDKKVGTLKGTESQIIDKDRTITIPYNFITRSDVQSGYTKLSFTITYRTEVGGEKITETKELFVKTVAAPEPTPAPTTAEPAPLPEPMPPEETVASVPRVIVSGFTTEPADVKAGGQFKLTLRITNTSSKTAVNNLEFNIQSEAEGADPATAAAAFLPVAGSSTVFLKSIGKEETKEITMDMTAKADLAQKPYIINLAMKYEDSKANQYESESSVSIPVQQEARLDVSDFQVMPDGIMVGQEANVMFSIYNTGKTKLYNTSVKFVSDSISGGDAFAGNIEPGATANIDIMLAGQMPTMDDGIIKVLVTYEDEAGKENTIEKEITLFVNEEFIDENPMFPDEEFPMEEEGGTSPLVPIIIIVILLIIGGVVFVILRRRKMKKEGMEDEISWFDFNEHR